jgi:hypothetical protein
MRTTLTLDDDVAAELTRMQKSREVSFKELVNDALRRGLRDLRSPAKDGKAFRTPTFRMGEQFVDIDNVAEALAFAEGERFR